MCSNPRDETYKRKHGREIREEPLVIWRCSNKIWKWCMQEEDGTINHVFTAFLAASLLPLGFEWRGMVILWCICTNIFLFILSYISYCSPPYTIYFFSRAVFEYCSGIGILAIVTKKIHAHCYARVGQFHMFLYSRIVSFYYYLVCFPENIDKIDLRYHERRFEI
jgi:hypothetical protein